MGPDAMILVFWMLSFKPTFPFSSFTFIKRLFSSSSLSAKGCCHLRIWGYWYFSQKSWFQLVIHPAQHFAHKLNYHSDNTPWCIPFPIWTSQLLHLRFFFFLTQIHISHETGQIVWNSHLLKNFPQFVVIHTVKGFHVVNGAEGDAFLEFPCFLYDLTNVGNLISGSFAFFKPRLYIWKFSVHILGSKSNLNDFEHNLTNMQNEHNRLLVWIFFGIALLWDWNETDLFQSCGHCRVFQIRWHIESCTLTALSFRFLNSIAGTPSSPLALFIIMLPKAHLTSYSRVSGSRWMTTALWLSG